MDKDVLKFKNTKAQEVLDNLPGMVFRVINDGHWTFAYANKGVKKLLGYTRSELIDLKKLRKMIPREDVATNQKLLSELSPENPNLTTIYRLNVASGETQPRHSDFRLIAASNSNIEDLVRTGKMREDFYYRINTLRLRTPPLREREEDIIVLTNHFLAKFSQEDPPPRLSAHKQSILLKHRWPGNVQELQNVIYRYCIHGSLDLTEEPFVKTEPEKSQVIMPETNGAIAPVPSNVAVAPVSASGDMVSGLEQMERKIIRQTLQQNRWHIGKSAQDLGLSRRTMQRRMRKYHLKK